MRKSSLFLMFLIFLLALGFAASEEIKDEKMSVDLIFNASVLNDTLEIHVLLPNDATGSVLYTIDGKEHKVNVKNGDAPLNVTDLKPGKYELKANYSGDDKYLDIENKTKVIIPEVDKLALGDNSTNNGTNDTNPVKNVTNKTNNVTNRTDSKNVTNNATNKTNATNNVTNKTNATNNVTNKTNSKNDTNLLNNLINKTDSKNATNPLKNVSNNTANPVNNVTNKTNNTVVNNNTTAVVTDNQTANNTAVSNDKSVDNNPAATHNSPKKPKINQDNNPFKLDAKTGIPIALVIIAIAIFVGIKRYNL